MRFVLVRNARGILTPSARASRSVSAAGANSLEGEIPLTEAPRPGEPPLGVDYTELEPHGGSTNRDASARSEELRQFRKAYASVVITAHDRRQYLRRAIDSVLAQDADRSAYEIIVVKNFVDPDVDALLDSTGGQHILSTVGPVAGKVADGLRVCQGEIILFLEDDDLFDRTKVRRVISEFRSNPSLGFYHNRLSTIDENGTPLVERPLALLGLRPPAKARRVYLRAQSKLTQLGRLTGTFPDFNSSSLAIRKDLALEVLPYLLRIPGGVDTFFFFAALASDFDLLIDDAVLTQYRVHSENVSLAAGPDPAARRSRLLDSARRQDRVNRVTREMIADSGNPAILREMDGRMLIHQLSIIYRDPRTSRAEAARALVKGLQLRKTLAVRENGWSLASAALFATIPSAARFVYDHQQTIR